MKKKVMKMICPKCHNENKYDALTCDFCMARLPMTKEREEEIKRKQKIEKKAKLNKSITKLVGLLMGLFLLIGIVVIVYLIRK
jgi:hypothetical protein